MKINHVFMRHKHGFSLREKNDQLPLVTGLVHLEHSEDDLGLYYELMFNYGEKDYISVNGIKNGLCEFVVQ